MERMHLWICKRKSSYPLYKKECACDNPDGVSWKRKTDWVFDPYETHKVENDDFEQNNNSQTDINYIELE